MLARGGRSLSSCHAEPDVKIKAAESRLCHGRLVEVRTVFPVLAGLCSSYFTCKMGSEARFSEPNLKKFRELRPLDPHL